MKKLIAVCVAFVFVFASFERNTIAEKVDKFHRASNPVPDRYIVVFSKQSGELSSTDVYVVAAELQNQYSGTVKKVFSSAVKGYAVEMKADEAERLSNDPRVEYVEEDAEVRSEQVVTEPGWGLDRIDQRSLPFDLQYQYNSTGAGVNVYVLDAGVMTTHEGLSGRAFDDYNATSDHTPVENCSSHGTGVAGVVAGAGSGAARSALIHSVRVLPCSGTGLLSDLIAGVDWVSRHAVRPAVVNMSVETSYSRTLNSSVTTAVRNGVTVVAAAGNDGGDACNYSPASTPEAITVGATSANDQRVGYSNIGSCVSLFAPGEGIFTIWNNSPTATTYMSGTSFASPMVAGVAALYLSAHPAASPAEVKNAIISNATSSAVIDPGPASPNILLYSLLESPPPSGCSGTTYAGTIQSGRSAYQSNSNGFGAGTGEFDGSLNVPAGAVFNLTLEKKSKNRWSAVSTSGSSVSYGGRTGTYRWRIDAVSAGGDYSLCSVTP